MTEIYRDKLRSSLLRWLASKPSGWLGSVPELAEQVDVPGLGLPEVLAGGREHLRDNGWAVEFVCFPRGRKVRFTPMPVIPEVVPVHGGDRVSEQDANLHHAPEVPVSKKRKRVAR